MNKKQIEEKTKELESIVVEMVSIIQCLETIENSIYYASERKDKDVTKACSAAIEQVIRMAEGLQERVEELGFDMKAIAEEA